MFSYYRRCSLTIEGVPLLQNVFPYYRTCSHTIEVFTYHTAARKRQRSTV